MWNCLDLKCPSDDLAEYPPQDHYMAENLRDIVTVLTTAADSLTSEDPLWIEMGVLRSIQVKYKRTLRCDNCLTYLQRVGHCLKKMVLLNLSRTYLDLAERFLGGLHDSSMTLHIPSRQQLEYVLLRTLGAAKLISEGIKYSRDTFCYLIQKLKVGHSVLDLVMATSVTARLNILLRATLEKLCSTYEQVLSWRYKLKNGAHQWSEKLDFHQSLGEWLKTFETGYLDPLPMSEADIDLLSNRLNRKDNKRKPSNGDKESDSESVIVIDEVNRNGSSVENGMRMDNDYGEVIPRKKVKTHHETPEQKLLLQKIVEAQSLKDLTTLWDNIQGLSREHLPNELTEKKKSVINKFFMQIRNNVSAAKFNKTLKNYPNFFKKACSMFCKHLGFREGELEACRNDLDSSKLPVKLEPVKTFSELRVLYKHLCAILKFSEEDVKLRKLKKLYKRQIADIKLLKQNGEKKTANNLIFCTSKVLLTNFQK